MALILKTDLANGTTGNYWKIIQLCPNYLNGYMEITLGLFKDKSFRDSLGVIKGDEILKRQSFVLKIDPIELKNANLLELSYSYLRTLETYKGAVNG